jgi:hypothetical protein
MRLLPVAEALMSPASSVQRTTTAVSFALIVMTHSNPNDRDRTKTKISFLLCC